MLRILRPVVGILYPPHVRTLGLMGQQGLSSICWKDAGSPCIFSSPYDLASGAFTESPQSRGSVALSTGTVPPDSANSGSLCVGGLRLLFLPAHRLCRALPNLGRRSWGWGRRSWVLHSSSQSLFPSYC